MQEQVPWKNPTSTTSLDSTLTGPGQGRRGNSAQESGEGITEGGAQGREGGQGERQRQSGRSEAWEGEQWEAWGGASSGGETPGVL